MMQNSRIKIYTRSANVELYYYSQKLIDLPYPRVRLYGTTADGYFFQMLEDSDCDIAINIDEDAFVIDNEALQSLVEYVVENNIVCCGMRDGGVLPIRFCNPIIQNPFFNIINLKVIRNKFSREEIENFDYEANKAAFVKLMPKELKNYEGLKYDNYEPYYRFFFWLAKNFKLKYLDVAEHEDGCTTVVFNQEHRPVVLHTWWSREFKRDTFHTNRILNVINEAYYAQRKKKPNLRLVKVWRWFEYKSQQLMLWWEYWSKVGNGRWIISHARKSPVYYLRKICVMIKCKL